ncbi:MAG: epoxyqueuosine reductase QueH [Clostridiales bacterium]|jgi:predicted adenine nucleotide alpha hydrolase (AANH) superfamily ATPase|nr:epoxyqueuosine reductase QueH [Clostridiales bacterium]
MICKQSKEGCVVLNIKILLHTCCGPCGVAFTGGIIKEGFAPVLLWHNPNIHPFTEYKSRRGAALDFAALYQLPMEADDFYGLRKFVGDVAADGDRRARCAYCYHARLAHTAKYAAQNGYTAFSTTLLASPYQDFEAICKFGRELAEMYGCEFVIRDFREGFRAAMDEARKMGLYMQKYCGCIFSEEERYRKFF